MNVEIDELIGNSVCPHVAKAIVAKNYRKVVDTVNANC